MDIASLATLFTTLLYMIYVTSGHESTGLTFELEDNEKLCFYEEFKKQKNYVMVYQVLRGGLQDVDVNVEAPNGNVIFEQSKKARGTLQFTSTWGRYAFCFSNEFSSISHKVVYFELRPEEHKPLAVEAGIKRPSANTQIEESMEGLHKMNSDMIRLQRSYRLKEAQGRFVADVLNKGVFWWSAGQTLVILLAGISQVFILKCFFTESRKSSVPGEGEEVVYAEPLVSA